MSPVLESLQETKVGGLSTPLSGRDHQTEDEKRTSGKESWGVLGGV